MKPLAERLAEYKILRRAIEKSEEERGYYLSYNCGNVSFKFREFKGHLLVEREVNSFTPMVGAVDLYDVGEEQKAKDSCKKMMMNYLRKSTHLWEGEIWHHNKHPYRMANGHVSVIGTFPSFVFGGDKFLKGWSKLSDLQRERINRRRLERGLLAVA